jgi:hypothetical protein
MMSGVTLHRDQRVGIKVADGEDEDLGSAVSEPVLVVEIKLDALEAGPAGSARPLYGIGP